MSGSPPPLADPLDALPPGLPVGHASAGLAATAHLPLLLGRPAVRIASGAEVAALVTWGVRSPGWRAERLARVRALPILRIEDPFYRSVGLGKEAAPSLGLTVDDRGIYYDARRPSRLEAILSTEGWDQPDLMRRARAARDRAVAERLSKYNLGSDAPCAATRDCIVLVDQVAGDRSIAGSGADHATFMRMLRDALERHPAKRLALRVHPDVARGYARGYLLDAARSAGIRIVDDDVSPHAILDTAAEIWTVSSQLGFEALLRGVRVTTFGMPFYAGWGATEDSADGEIAAAARRRRLRRHGAEAIFAAANLIYSRWFDPLRHEPCDFETAQTRLLEWREVDRRRAGRPIVAFGFTPWKQRRSEMLLGSSMTPVVFASGWTPPKSGESVHVCVWGMRDRPGFETKCRAAGHRFSRVEDGFIRSVGLGAELNAAGSYVVDGESLYFDGTRASGLETLLARQLFDDDLRARAAALRARIVANRITKYNLGADTVDLRGLAAGRRIALVVGQVPGDQATRLGAGAFSDSLSLVRAARAAAPEAYLVFKEHPDVVAGHRRGHGREADIAAIADRVLVDGDMAGLVDRIDEMHVLSSLAGFEALLRGVAVVTWGRPFYAGWGLTRDMADFPRRGRVLSLDELVAGALILYPRYVEPLTGIPVEVEQFIEALATLPKAPRPPKPWTHRMFLAARRAWFRRFPHR